MFATMTQTEDRTYKTILEVIAKIIRLYKVRGFLVECLLTDDEFLGLALSLLKEGVLRNETASNDIVCYCGTD